MLSSQTERVCDFFISFLVIILQISPLQNCFMDQSGRLYGINVCGEGGEYETVTLDCPLFKVSVNFTIFNGSPSYGQRKI